MNYTVSPKNRISLGSTGNALVLLLMANAVLFVLLIFFKVFYFMTATSNVASVNVALFHKEIFDYFVLSAQGSVTLHRPWTLLSYMFSHESLLALLSNLLWLAAFGFILQSLAANRKMIPLYLYGGLFGGLIFVLCSTFIPHSAHMAQLVGATPALIAVAAGTTTLGPKYRIFPMLGGGIPLWVLFVIFMAINLSAGATAGLPLILAYAGCALLGFFVIWSWDKKGRDYCEWMYNLVYRIDDIFNPDKKTIKKGGRRQQLFYKTSGQPYKRTELITQERVDELLDKIKLKGYKSLSKEEKAYLERASKK
ncbi:rhomboid family intramembrane serine protease [Arachidicoccus terrestris]|uniref:rhomboid family intramembrane serine protease n=1 Tax=Arachidicoccus terrestris TaxID=2875539 RepID=UPI001CC662EF|nr:rhomboid family intramembrane serine protease [Arachidicoccus terrestris]UAY56075.1 rhomboid family intramembrane serine protease [Arachidicoccus terrestris]